MEPSSVHLSPLDLMSALLTGNFDWLEDSRAGNRGLLMFIATSIAVLVGCAVIFLWRRSGVQKVEAEPPKRLVVREPEEEVDDGKKKVTVFFGTQTGTAEGFAKVN
ncbi:hypothetical protein V2J09_002377 [Rumex salicifolius]